MPANRCAVARVEQGGGLALMTLITPVPAEVSPAVLAPCGRLTTGREVSIFGYPLGQDRGAWSHARLVGGEGPWPRRVRVDSDGIGYPVLRRFVGAGALDESGAVIGVVVAGDRTPDARSVCRIPTESWARVLPALGGVLGGGTTADTAQPAPTVVQRLVTALLDVSMMRDASARHALIQALRPEIAGVTPRYSSALFDIYALVRTCLDYPGGLAELMSSIRTFDGEGSEPVRRVEQLIIELRLWGR